jgi:hypothetical protein
MALTADEETDVRALLAAVKKLRSPLTLAQSIPDQKVRQAVANLESAIRELVESLR